MGEILLEGVPLARGSTAYLPNYLLAIFLSLILGIHPRQKKMNAQNTKKEIYKTLHEREMEESIYLPKKEKNGFISFMGGEKQMESKLIRKINKRRQSEKEREK